MGDGTFETHGYPIQLVPGGVKAVACGETFTIFLKDDGSLWGFGSSGEGALGTSGIYEVLTRPVKIVDSGVVTIAAGYEYTLFIKRDGSLWGMGGNGCGQLGLGTNVDHTFVPVQIVASNAAVIAAEHGHSLFIKTDGSLWGMGMNDSGQIGDCTIDWPYRPKEVVSNNVVAVYGEGIEFHSECPTQIYGSTNSALVAGYYYNAQLKSYVSVWADKFNNNPAGAGAAQNKSGLQSGALSFPGYNSITVEPLMNGDVRLIYSGTAGANYALERSSSLANPNWVSLVTNKALSGGVLVITNTPDTSMNNFWRIRSVR